MRFLTIILLLISVKLTFAENMVEDSLLNTYQEIVLYTPESFNVDSSGIPEFLLDAQIDDIITVKFYYDYSEDFGFSSKVINWLEMVIRQLAISFHNENRNIRIGITGGASGCNDLLQSSIINGREILKIKLCYTCTESTTLGRRLTIIFNEQMEFLDLKLEEKN